MNDNEVVLQELLKAAKVSYENTSSIALQAEAYQIITKIKLDPDYQFGLYFVIRMLEHWQLLGLSEQHFCLNLLDYFITHHWNDQQKTF